MMGPSTMRCLNYRGVYPAPQAPSSCTGRRSLCSFFRGGVYSQRGDGIVATELKTRLDYDDYCGIAADGKRYELIDGKVHVAPAPSPLHQRVVLRLARTLSDHFTAPAEVQPDVVLVTNPSHVSKRAKEGVPLLVVEVPAPPTTAYSRTTKAQRHASKGEMMKHSMKILTRVAGLSWCGC